MPIDQPSGFAHQHCRQTIDELLEENAALRKAGADFGALAERLNRELRVQKRSAGVLDATWSVSQSVPLFAVPRAT
jgi:hypothetical protein